VTTESILTKRQARYKGERGLFADNPMAEEDLALYADGEEVRSRNSSDRKIEALKYLWGLIHKVAENSDRYMDKNEAMNDLKMRAAFTKLIYNNRRKEVELRPKSLAQIGNDDLRLLTQRITDIICTEILPGMEPNVLRREIEEMVGLRK
jgi:hypothetical protein